MKVYGIFRGFPGLGRVMSGIALLTTLKEMGHVVKAYSYLQGVNALINHQIDRISEKQPDAHHVMAIGLNPICELAGEIIEKIRKDQPDLVIVDGEALFISTLSMVYPREKIISLLNPSDVYNNALPESSIKFYHKHYFAAGTAIIHGINKDKIVIPNDNYGCNIIRVNTIVRRSIVDSLVVEPKEIVTILGGGCQNASEGFIESTVQMGHQVLDAAKLMKEERFVIFCNDRNLAKRLETYKESGNISIVSEYMPPEKMYSKAKAVICRAGRNTISEILCLDIPAILMSTSGDFRSVEQEKNMEQVCNLRPNRLICLHREEEGEQLVEKIGQILIAPKNEYVFIPGNKEAMQVILNLIS